MNATSIPRMPLVKRTIPGRRVASHGLYHYARFRQPARLGVAPRPLEAARLQPHLLRPRRASVLFCACSRLCSLTAACFGLNGAPSPKRFAKPPFVTCPHATNCSAASTAPCPSTCPALRRREQQVSIDLVLIPYHGEPMQNIREIYRSQAKSGTTHFHAYATAYVNYRGQRYTLALTLVEHGEKMEEVIKRLLRRLTQLGIRMRMLLLDSGFWSVAVIRYLQAGRQPFLMPVVLRGRKDDHPKGPSGTRVFAIRKRGGWDEYTLTAANKQKGADTYLHPLSQLQRAVGQTRQADIGIRLLENEPLHHAVGEGDVSQAVRHRNELPADASRQGADLYTQSAGAVTAGGDRLGAAQRLGVVALRGPSTPRQGMFIGGLFEDVCGEIGECWDG